MPQAAKPKPIRLVCGLGNPGAEYAHTRHSAGFATVDELAARWGVRYWKEQLGCLVASYDLRLPDGTTRTVLLAKPQSYMNTSGGPLSKLMRAEHITPAELLVIHDEVDLPAGEVRAKWGGGLNAHNGLRSIASKLGTNDFGRIRERHRARGAEAHEKLNGENGAHNGFLNLFHVGILLTLAFYVQNPVLRFCLSRRRPAQKVPYVLDSAGCR